MGAIQLLVAAWIGTPTCKTYAQSRETAYFAWTNAPLTGSSLDALLMSWMDAEGFESLRAYLKSRSAGQDVSASEHAALGYLWRRLGEPVNALDHWEKATSAEPLRNDFWLERADLELRLNRTPQALNCMQKITRPLPLDESQRAVRLLGEIAHQSGDQAARQLLIAWMSELPNEIALALDLHHVLSRDDGTHPTWAARLAQWRKTTSDPALVGRICLHQYIELRNQGKWQDAYDHVRSALEETKPDSPEEAALLPMLHSLFAQTANQQPRLKPNAVAYARTQSQRPALVRALANVLVEEGQVDDALNVLNALADVWPQHRGIFELKLSILEENGRHTETQALLASQSDANPIALALTLRDSGLLEQARQTLAKLPASDRVRTMQALFAGNPLPFGPIPLQAPTEAPPLAEWKRTLRDLPPNEQARKLFQLWQTNPSDTEVAVACVHSWLRLNRRAEADHVFLTVFQLLDNSESKRAWCERCANPIPGDEFGQPFDLSRALLNAGRNLRETPDFWVALAEWASHQRHPASDALLREAAKRLQGDAALVIRLQAAETALDQKQLGQALHLATSLLGSTQDAAARILLARIDLQEGRVNRARRSLWTLSEDPAMTAHNAALLAAGLLRWGESTEASAFLSLQRHRFPGDVSLLILQLGSLNRTHQSEAWLQSLLAIGSLAPTPPTSQPHPPEANRSLLAPLQIAINALDLTSPEFLEGFSHATRGRRTLDLFQLDRSHLTLRHWATAQLLRYTEDQGLNADARRALSERAEKAGLPLASTLRWLRLDLSQPHSVQLTVDLGALEAEPLENWAVPSADLLVQRLAVRSGQPEPLGEQERRVLKKLTASLWRSQPHHSLSLSLAWWKHDPDSADARTAIRAQLAELQVLPSSFPQLLQSFLQQVPYQRRRDPLCKEATSTLDRWINLQHAGSESFAASALAASHCFLLVGEWPAAAAWAERAWQRLDARKTLPFAATPNASQPPPWIYWPSRPLLSWPPDPQNLPLANHFHFLVPSGHHTARSELFLEEDRGALLAARAELTPRPLQLLWALLGNDQETAKAIVREWHQVEPESQVAARLAAAVARVEGRHEEALDLLHAQIAKFAEASSEQRLAQLEYLQAALVPFSPNPFLRSAPPRHKLLLNSHAERVRQTLREFSAELIKWPAHQSSWLEPFAAAGLEELTSTWPQPKTAPMQVGENLEVHQLFHSNEIQFLREILSTLQPQYLRSREIESLLDQGEPKPALALLFRALKAEADEALIQTGSSSESWQSVLSRASVRDALLAMAAKLPRHHLRELNQALHMAATCGAWQTVIDWASEAPALLEAHPLLQYQVDWARLELGVSPAVVAQHFDRSPARTQHELLQGLTRKLNSLTNLSQRLRFAEWFIAVASKSPRSAALRGDVVSPLLYAVFESLTRAYEPPDQSGLVPSLYPEFDPNPPAAPIASPSTAIPQNLLEKRKQLHTQLCNLALQHTDWHRTSFKYLIQRHLVENEPSAEAMIDHLLPGQTRPPSLNSILINDMAAMGCEWRDVGLRLRLAELVLRSLKTIQPQPVDTLPFQQASLNAFESLLTLVGGEVNASTFPPLWALWEYPHDVTVGKRAYSSQQLAWNKERQAAFVELAGWALNQPALLPFTVSKWANYRLFFPDTQDEVLKHLRQLKDRTDDPFSLGAFLQTAQLAYDNQHHIRAVEVAITLFNELGPTEVTPQLVNQTFELLSKGRPDQAAPMPSLELEPEAIDPATHFLTSDQQRRRHALVEALGAWIEPRNLPPSVLLWKLLQAVRNQADTRAFEEALIAIGRSEPAQLNSALEALVHRFSPASDVDLVTRLHQALIRVGEGYVEAAASRNQSPSWLEQVLKPYSPSSHYQIIPLPHPSGLLNHLDPYQEPPFAWGKLNPQTNRLRRENFLKALDLCERDPQLRVKALSERLVNDLLEREKWPALFERLNLETRNLSRMSEVSLLDWLRWEQCFFDISRLTAATDFLIQWLAQLDASHPEGGMEWLVHTHHLFTRYISKGLDAREHVSLAPADSPLSPQWSSGAFVPNPKHLETVKKLRSEWLRLVEALANHPTTLPRIYYLLVDAYLESNPQRLSELTTQLPAQSLASALQSLYARAKNHSFSIDPLRFRLALVEFILQIPGAVEGSTHVGNGAQPPSIPSDLLTRYLDPPTSPSSYRPAQLIAQWKDPLLASRRETVLHKLAELMSRDEKIQAAQRVAHLLAAVAQRSPTPAEADEVLTHARSHPAAVLQTFLKAANLQSVSGNSITLDQRLAHFNQTELITQTLDRWPAPIDHSFDQLCSNLITSLGPYQDTLPEHLNRIAHLQERLVQAASSDNARTPYTFNAYANACCETEEGATRLRQRIGSLLHQSPQKANQALSFWLLPSHPLSARPLECVVRGLTLCRDLARDWPKEAASETLGWAQGVVNFSQKADLGLIQSFRAIDAPRNISARPSSHLVCRVLIDEILDLLHARSTASLHWLVPARLRHSARLAIPPAEVAKILRPCFEGAELPHTLRYFEEVLNASLPSFFTLDHVETDRHEYTYEVLEELRDTLRCLTAAAVGQLLPEAQVTALVDRVRSSELRVFAELRSKGLGNARIRGLAEDFSTFASLRFRKTASEPLAPTDLTAYIQSSLLQHTVVSDIVERVWQTVERAPLEGADSLKLWASNLNHITSYDAYRDAGPFVRTLLERWKAAWPAPDWAVIFLRTWRIYGWKSPESASTSSIDSLEYQEFTKLSKTLRPQLQHLLMGFPSCLEDDFFTQVVRTPDGLPSPFDPKMVSLAEAVVKHRLAAGRAPALLPDHLPSLTGHVANHQASSPLSSPLTAPTETWILLEHSLRSGSTPAIQALLATSAWEKVTASFALYASLKGLFLDSPESFVDHAQAFINAADKAQSKHDPSAWVLRIALMRDLTLSWQDWRRLHPPDPFHKAPGLSQSPSRSPMQHWVLYLHERGRPSFVSELVAYCREITAASPFALASAAPVNPSPRKGFVSSMEVPLTPFLSYEWNRAWECLIHAAQVGPTWPTVIASAAELGFLENTSLASALAGAPPRQNPACLDFTEWLTCLDATGLTRDRQDLTPFWFQPHDNSAFIWQLSSLLSDVAKPAALTHLAQHQHTQARLGYALLRLSLLASYASPSPQQLAQELAPVVSQLNRQPTPTRLAILRSLHVQVPRLSESIGTAAADSPLRALAIQAPQDSLPPEASRWLTGAISLENSSTVRRDLPEELSVVVKKLVLSNHPLRSEVFLQELDHLVQLLPPGDPPSPTRTTLALRVLKRLLVDPIPSSNSPSPSQFVVPINPDQIRIAGFVAAHLPDEVQLFESPRLWLDSLQSRRLVWNSLCQRNPLDGRLIAHEILHLAYDQRPEAVLVAFPAFRELILHLLPSVTDQMLDTLRESAEQDPARQALLWCVQQSLAMLRDPASDGIPWPPFLTARLKDPACPPLIRHWLARAAPRCVARDAPEALLAAARDCLGASTSSTVWRTLVEVDLRPILTSPPSAQTRASLDAFLGGFQSYVSEGAEKRSLSPTREEAAELETKIFEPLLRTLASPVDAARRLSLVESLGKAKLLSLRQLKQEVEAGTDPARFHLSMASRPGLPTRLSSDRELPVLTARSVTRLQRLAEPGASLPLRSLQHLLLAGPDSVIDPPPASLSQTQRFALWQRVSATDHELARDLLLHLSYSDWFIEASLPLLESQKPVSEFQRNDQHLTCPDDIFANNISLLAYHALLRWQTHRDANAWRRVLESMALRDRPSSYYRFAQPFLTRYLAQTLHLSDPENWAKEVPLLLSVLDSQFSQTLDPGVCQAFASAAAVYSKDPNVVQLTNLIKQFTPAIESMDRPLDERALWQKLVQRSDIPAIVRLQTAFVPSSANGAHPAQLDRILAAQSYGLVTPLEIAQQVDTIEVSTLAQHLFPVARWLQLNGQDQAALRLISRVLSEVPTSDSDMPINWAFVAELCRHAHRDDLVKDAVTRAESRKPTSQPALFYRIISRLKNPQTFQLE